MKKDLMYWRDQCWKPKAHYDCKLGFKGFFTIIFPRQEDLKDIMEGGPYFFNSTSLYMRK